MAIKNRYDFVMIFDVENGNPNGDPDAGNMPRVDPETGYGFVTDVCLKRKIRNYVDLVANTEFSDEQKDKYRILVKPERSLNSYFEQAYENQGLEKGKKGKNENDVNAARDYMCEHYYDVRTFGAVMATGDNPCGIVRGPVQINFARSISPVQPLEITITRQARTTDERKETGDTEMGRKSIIPYGLYRAEGYVSASLAQNVTGFSDEDLELLWRAVINMFEDDHSAARGKMCMRKLYVFKHDTALGNAPSHKLFDRITITETNSDNPPRSFDDYKVTVDEQNLPDGVHFESKI